jgi:hypothetical protein
MAQSPYLAELDSDTYSNGVPGFTLTRPGTALASLKTTVTEGTDGRRWFELSGAARLCISTHGPTSGFGVNSSADAQTTNYSAFGFRLKVDNLSDLVGIDLSILGMVRSANGSTAYYGIPGVHTNWLQSYITSIGEYYVEVRQYHVTPAQAARPGLSSICYEIWIDGIRVWDSLFTRSDYTIDYTVTYPPVIRIQAGSKLKFRDVYVASQFLNPTFKSARSLNIKTKAYRAKAISGYPNDLTDISNNLANGAINARHDGVVTNTLPTRMTGLGGQVDLTLDHVATRLRGTPIPVFRYGRVSGVDSAVEVKSLVDSSVLSSVANTPTPGAVVGTVNLSPTTIDPDGAKLKDVRVKFTQFVGGA